MSTTTGTWYSPRYGTGGFLVDAQLFTNPSFAEMTDTDHDLTGRGQQEGEDMTPLQIQVIQWMATRETGASSMTMALWLGFGERYRHCSYPHDPADLRRCVEFLEAAPLCRPLLFRMGSLSPQWAQIVARWDELEALLRGEMSNLTGKAPQTYALMLKLRKQAS